MAVLMDVLVVIVQLVLAGFVMWGGLLWLGQAFRFSRAAPASEAVEEEKSQGFGRVASLVLLALLCTVSFVAF